MPSPRQESCHSPTVVAAIAASRYFFIVPDTAYRLSLREDTGPTGPPRRHRSQRRRDACHTLGQVPLPREVPPAHPAVPPLRGGHDATRRVRTEPQAAQAGGGGLRLAEDRGRWTQVVYLSVASSPRHFDALHEVADEDLPLRDRPLLQEAPEVRHVLSDLLGRGQLYLSARKLSRCSRAAASWSSRRRSERIRGDSASSVRSLFSSAS